MIISLSTYPGTKTREIAKLIALYSGMRYVSRDVLMTKLAYELEKNVEEAEEELRNNEEIVSRFKKIVTEEVNKKDVIIDDFSAAWNNENKIDLRVFLKTSKSFRAEELSRKEKIPFGEAMKIIEDKEKEMSLFYLKHFRINIYDWNIYDIVLNTEKLDLYKTVNMLSKAMGSMKK